MCIQLKRFDYDWESNRSLKFDDYFQFPRQLNVSPYTYDSINKSRLNAATEDSESSMETSSLQPEKQQKLSKKPDKEEITYELVGIVVHSGQANAGHYYSFIKGSAASEFSLSDEIHALEQMNQSSESITNANDSTMTNESDSVDGNNSHTNSNSNFGYMNSNDKWYKFNDTTVEEINLNDVTLMGFQT
jgi:ubiquitin C-terminal hydrolase